MPRECSEPNEASFDGIVLAGGAARRFGGVDKAMLRVDGTALLDGVLTALRGARSLVVVGPRRPVAAEVEWTRDEVEWTREQPPGAGPVAALAAGLAALPRPHAPRVLLCAADLSGFTAASARRLLEALATEQSNDGVVLRDEHGRAQWLAGAWRNTALRSAIPEQPADASLRATIGGLRFGELPARAGEAADVDTAEDLSAVRSARCRSPRAP